MHRRLTTVLVALVASAATRSVRAQAKACPAEAIDSSTMLNDLTRLADDSMQGRRVGTTGNFKARDFIAARFDALGLDRIPPGRIQPFTAPTRRGTISGFNVVGLIAGSASPNEYIVVSAHFDHIGRVEPGAQCRPTGADSICNGADDNASGTAALLALARLFEQERPRHSIAFVAFDAEESGDVGSHAWMASPPMPVDQMLIDVNMDMVGRNVHNELYAAGPTKYPKLRPLVEATIGCSAIKLTIGHDGPGAPGGDDWTNQSDQGAFNDRGIPFVYFGEEDHPDYHRATDHADRIMPAFYTGAVRDVADFIRRIDAAPPKR
ncbi:MAG TPA: M28 family peptidase [Gemmatimonadales bacterium]